MIETKLFDLSEAQKRVFYTQLLYPDSSMYYIGGVSKIHGAIRIDCLKEAITKVISLYDAMQIRICKKNDNVYQYFDTEYVIDVEIVDFTKELNAQESFEKWMGERVKHRMELFNSPLYDIKAFKLSENEYGYYIKMHHIISDGWSIQLLTKKISEYYDSIYHKREIKSEKVYSYKEYLESEMKYLASDRYKKNREFWLEEFADLPDLELKYSNSIKGKRLTYHVSEEISAQMYQICKQYKVSLNTLFVALYLLAKELLNQEEEQIITIPSIGRFNKSQMTAVGMFVSTIPLRYKFTRDVVFDEYMNELNTKLKSLYLQQRYPYNHLVKELDERENQFHMFNNVSINYYNTQPSCRMQGYEVVSQEFYNGEQDYDLQIIIRDWNDSNRIQVDFDYKIDSYQEEQIHTLYSLMIVLMEQVIQEPKIRKSNFDLLSKEMRALLVDEYNDTEKDYPKDKAIIELFHEQVVRTPDRIAIECDQNKLTYEQLHEKSNQLATYLYKQGISSNDNVCLLMSNSIEAVVAILAVLKLGATYCPVDIAYPEERIQYIKKNTGAKAIITNQASVKENEGNVIYIKDIFKFQYESIALPSEYDADSLAYIIYTSGSTGNPKGVMVKNKGLTNYIWWAVKTYVDGVETFPLFTSLSFDLTVTSIFIIRLSAKGTNAS